MGRAIVAGGKPALGWDLIGVKASDLAVGSSVYLMENGVAAEYLVVNQGIPSNSSLYDTSCNGTWLLRKDIYEEREVHFSKTNVYESSELHSYLNGLTTISFPFVYDKLTRDTIKQVKIPYRKNGGTNGTDQAGESGLSAKVFLLSGYEVGWTTSNSSGFPVDGACLEYFTGCADTDSRRIAHIEGSATLWWTRSPSVSSTQSIFGVTANGGRGSYYATAVYGVRPALIIPFNAYFDKEKMTLMGVA